MKALYFILSYYILLSSTSANECLDKSRLLFNKGKYIQSISKTKECLIDLIDSRNTKLLKDAYFGLGINYNQIGELDSAIKYFKFAEEINKKDDFNMGFASSLYNEIGITNINKGLNHNAIFYLNKALTINKETNNSNRIVNNLINLGNSFYKINALDSSQKSYEDALHSLDKSNLTDRNIVLNNLSIVYNEKGDLDKAIKVMGKVVENLGDISNVDSLYYRTNLDILLIKNGTEPRFSNEISNYIEITKDNEVQLADALFKQSIYHVYQNDIRQAFNYLNKANSIYVSKQNISEAINISTFFSSIIKNDHSQDLSLDENISELRKKELSIYSDLLIKEIDFKAQLENSILLLNEELEFAWSSTKLLIVIIVSLIILIPLFIKHIITLKLLSKLRNQLIVFNHEVSLLHDKKIKNQLGKFISLMILSKKFDDNELLVETIDEIVEGSNELSVFLNNINRSLNVNNTSTTLELSMEREQPKL